MKTQYSLLLLKTIVAAFVLLATQCFAQTTNKVVFSLIGINGIDFGKDDIRHNYHNFKIMDDYIYFFDGGSLSKIDLQTRKVLKQYKISTKNKCIKSDILIGKDLIGLTTFDTTNNRQNRTKPIQFYSFDTNLQLQDSVTLYYPKIETLEPFNYTHFLITKDELVLVHDFVYIHCINAKDNLIKNSEYKRAYVDIKQGIIYSLETKNGASKFLNKKESVFELPFKSSDYKNLGHLFTEIYDNHYYYYYQKDNAIYKINLKTKMTTKLISRFSFGYRFTKGFFYYRIDNEGNIEIYYD